ncbi:hypothetical protein CROSSROADS_129 [Mycobacterium phage Crossroads]|uniref:hypothetical protein n=1 Tax=Mycobacterium phage Crossroads TaxID=1340836 RepID=UPI000387E0CA|nr:hypothetical protein N848_gp124 [Mycobacterium phage Crossroads]ANH50117.1 hypothetical protein SEA_LOADRIE_127 [Mycobacterium phage Loadrie]AOT23101.1 hypothetical protein SEA_WILDER_127 [Mycobacterium phage Wilder]AYD84479.1 hypothetical protein SEA_LILDESTINE_123 [Mycobacterium phage LilDestine]QDH92619.1 hypothetical protein SEA_WIGGLEWIGGLE_127 [Mycobacterium phage Wigglewiggle]QGJ96422.1 hypothetical protein SEA_KAHLID_126 [Mycobacterium phage Kahlid]UJQ87120.1 hypothetical protein S
MTNAKLLSKTIGVGPCRVCGKGTSLLKTHICPRCAAKRERPFAIDVKPTKHA